MIISFRKYNESTDFSIPLTIFKQDYSEDIEEEMWDKEEYLNYSLDKKFPYKEIVNLIEVGNSCISPDEEWPDTREMLNKIKRRVIGKYCKFYVEEELSNGDKVYGKVTNVDIENFFDIEHTITFTVDGEEIKVDPYSNIEVWLKNEREIKRNREVDPYDEEDWEEYDLNENKMSSFGLEDGNIVRFRTPTKFGRETIRVGIIHFYKDKARKNNIFSMKVEVLPEYLGPNVTSSRVVVPHVTIKDFIAKNVITIWKDYDDYRNYLQSLTRLSPEDPYGEELWD